MLFSLLFLSPVTCSAAEGMEGNGDGGELSLADEGIQGVIIDDTMTIIGRRFYNAFSIAWLDYQQVGKGENFSIPRALASGVQATIQPSLLLNTTALLCVRSGRKLSSTDA